MVVEFFFIVKELLKLLELRQVAIIYESSCEFIFITRLELELSYKLLTNSQVELQVGPTRVRPGLCAALYKMISRTRPKMVS